MFQASHSKDRPYRSAAGTLNAALGLGVGANATSDEDGRIRGIKAPTVRTQSYILRPLFYQIASVRQGGFLNNTIG